jgi:ABC-type antimicrobial peptide transport system permease subunit
LKIDKALVIAFFIAAPVAWFIMDQWLQNFTYRIHINPGSFLLALTGTFIIATITVAYHSLKSALSNPVKSLGTE